MGWKHSHKSLKPHNVWSQSSPKFDLHPNQHTLLLQKMLMRLYSDYYNNILEHSLLNNKKTRKQPNEKWRMYNAISKYLCVPTIQKYRVGDLKVTNVWHCNETLPLECCDDYSTQPCNTISRTLPACATNTCMIQNEVSDLSILFLSERTTQKKLSGCLTCT